MWIDLWPREFDMVIASHVIFSAYGFWLPNDPRGSWSEFVGAWDLFRAGGRATRTETRRSVAAMPHDHQWRLQTKESLKYPAVWFNDAQRTVIARGFGEFIEKSGLMVFACAILPDHVHLVIAQHRYPVEQAVTLLKGAATRVLEAEGLHPMARFPRRGGRLASCWARGEWKVFLNQSEDVARAVAYVEQNPLKAALPPQTWPFVRPWREYVLV